MQGQFNFSQFISHRRDFLKENSHKSFAIQSGHGGVMLSAPHGVSQVRLGRRKFEEPGSLSFMLEVAKRTGAPFIAKTRNCDDDANFDENCEYKNELKKFVQTNQIKFLLDFHGLSKKRDVDINFGTHLGQNVKSNESLFEELNKKLQDASFMTTIDNPFWGGAQTISGSLAEQTKIWTLQVEINCKYTNYKENVSELEKLLKIFEEFVSVLNEKYKI